MVINEVPFEKAVDRPSYSAVSHVRGPFLRLFVACTVHHSHPLDLLPDTKISRLYLHKTNHNMAIQSDNLKAGLYDATAFTVRLDIIMHPAAKRNTSNIALVLLGT